jgi:hypothetical protein
MAVTCSSWTQTVFGDRRAVFGTVTVAALTSGAIQTPLSIIQGGAVTPQSQASAVPTPYIQFNIGSSTTAINGSLHIGTCTAGDAFNVFLFGE